LSYNITAAHILPTTQIYFSQEYYSETDGWKKNYLHLHRLFTNITPVTLMGEITQWGNNPI